MHYNLRRDFDEKIFFIFSIFILTLTACSDPNQDEFNEISTIKKIGYVKGPKGNFSVLEDQVHGCLYLFYVESTRAGISPYYDENGKVKGCKGEESQKIKNNNGNE